MAWWHPKLPISFAPAPAGWKPPPCGEPPCVGRLHPPLPQSGGAACVLGGLARGSRAVGGDLAGAVAAARVVLAFFSP